MSERWNVSHSSVLDALASMPDNSVDAILTDVPYGIGQHQPTPEEIVAYLSGSELNTGGDFMGRDWHVPSVETWREFCRVLKPGGHLLSFAGSRTGDLISLGMRMARFEIRDWLTYLYAKGFPKSLNISRAIDRRAGATREVVGARMLTGSATVSTSEKGGTYGVQVGTVPAKEVPITAPATELAKKWDGYGTALKPAWEPIILARKPSSGTAAANVEKWGVGGLAIDACRIGRELMPKKRSGGTLVSSNTAMSGGNYNRLNDGEAIGRFPANLVLAHTEDCRDTPNGEGCTDDCPIYLLDKQAGNRPSRKSITRNGGGNQGGPVFSDRIVRARPDGGYTDDGGPSRFFFCAKVSTRERELGCEHLPLRTAGECTDRKEGSAGLKDARAGAGRTGGSRNPHPTLKPVALTKWLATLLLPPERDTPRTILVPYAGAGSEMIGAILAGWDRVEGIERDAQFIEILNARVGLAERDPDAFRRFLRGHKVSTKKSRGRLRAVRGEQLSIFDLTG